MVKKNKHKVRNFLIVSSIIIVLAVSIFIVFSFTPKQSIVSYNNQCGLPSCPSGYNSTAITCDNSTLICTQNCSKITAPTCGTYGSYSLVGNISNIEPKGISGNYYVDTPSYTLDSSHCYNVYSIGGMPIWSGVSTTYHLSSSINSSNNLLGTVGPNAFSSTSASSLQSNTVNFIGNATKISGHTITDSYNILPQAFPFANLYVASAPYNGTTLQATTQCSYSPPLAPQPTNPPAPSVSLSFFQNILNQLLNWIKSFVT